VDDTDCLPQLFCVDGICCNSPCNGPNQSCDNPSAPGICQRPRSAPAVSPPVAPVVVVILLGLAWLGLQQLRRKSSR
jgi:hypothetical protein